MSQGIIAVLISLLAAWLALRSFGKSVSVHRDFINLVEALKSDLDKLEELEMTAEEKIKKIEDIVKWTDEGLRFNELKGNEEFEYKALNYDKIREIIKEQE